MSFSIRLLSIKCLEESDESSDADEPYVLVTSCRMLTPVPGTPVATTYRYGEWTNFDENDVLNLIGERPFWGMFSEPWEPEDIGNADNVCFIVTVVEHDHSNIDGCRGLVETAATSSLVSSLTLPRAARVTRLLNAIRSAVGAIDLVPTSDDHVGSKELRLDSSDIAIAAGTSKDKKLEIDGGDEGKWELVFRIVHHQRSVFLPGTRLAAVSRASDLMDLWAINQNGALCGNWFHGRWHGWYTLPGVTFNAGTNLAAVNRHEKHMEVWAVGQDGVMRGIWFNGSKWQGWYSLTGATFQPGAPVAAVSRHPDRMEIWCVDTDGMVRGKFFDAGWKPEGAWYKLDGARFPQGVYLAAATRGANHMQIWVVGDDRPILSNRFDGNQWSGWDPLAGEMFSPGTRVAATVLKDKHNMHVLAVDMNQHVRDFWYEGDNKRGWYQAGSEIFDQGTPIAAVSRHPELMEAWAVAPSGVMRDDPHVNSGWTGWFALDGASFPPRAEVAAVSMRAGHMEVWAVGSGVISGNSFSDDAWHGWYPLRWSFVA